MPRHGVRWIQVPALLVLVSSAAGAGGPAGARAAGATPDDYLARVGGARVVAPTALTVALAALHRTIPAFSRQTGLACSQCHYQFLHLTPFGRMFKLNGYTLTGLTPITQPGDTSANGSLKLSPIPGVAAMAVISATNLAKAQPATQNATVAFPQEFSVFLAGALTPRMGAFTQLTYEGAAGAIGIDNVDIRYANHGTWRGRDVLLGVTLHNNPTVQDVWNTVPAWSYPFMSSGTAPSSIASTLIDGGLEQQVLGIGAYSLYNNVLYTELTAYRSAPQGVAAPLDTTAENTTKGVIPYWRAALQHAGQDTYWMIGTFGFAAQLYPAGVTGPVNRYTDAALDAQVERRVGSGQAMVIGRATYIHEKQQLDATFGAGESANLNDNVSTARANVSLLPNLRFAATLGYFQTSGTTDATLYAPNAFTGSRTGSPNTSGFVAELQHNPWQNTRFGLQYVFYSKFNGAGTAYDVAGGRSASDNNTLYVYTWLAF